MDFIYIGIDISKRTLDLSVYKKEKTKEENLHVTNDKNGFVKIVSWVKRLGIPLS